MMKSPRPLPTTRSAALALAACLAGPSAAQVLDPFVPGERWRVAPAPEDPWLPEDVVLAAGGELVWAAPGQADPGLLVLPGSDGGDVAPLLSAPGDALPGTRLCAGEEGRLLFALVVDEGPADSPTARHHRVVAHDPLAAVPPAPRWEHDLGLLEGGAVHMACDRAGDALVLAIHDPAAGTVELSWLDPASGAVTRTRVLPGGALRALEVAEAGERVLLVLGTTVWILGDLGQVVYHEPGVATTSAAALAEDGSLAVFGRAGALTLLREQPGGWYARAQSLPTTPGEVLVRAAISADGAVLAGAWWEFGSGAGLRVGAWDGADLAPRLAWSRSSPTSPVQDYPSALEVTPDGARLALGAWGTNDAGSEVVLFDVPTGRVVLEADLGGSALCLALAPSGTRVAAAAKHAHANQFATSGDIRLLDTGEHDLALTAPARLGGALSLASRSEGSLVTWFLLGAELGTPLPLEGIDGPLTIDPAAPMIAVPLNADAEGRADLVVPLPLEPALAGLPLAIQALFVVPGAPRLSAATARPLIL
jgi:hypothetical protein